MYNYDATLSPENVFYQVQVTNSNGTNLQEELLMNSINISISKSEGFSLDYSLNSVEPIRAVEPVNGNFSVYRIIVNISTVCSTVDFKFSFNNCWVNRSLTLPRVQPQRNLLRKIAELYTVTVERHSDGLLLKVGDLFEKMNKLQCNHSVKLGISTIQKDSYSRITSETIITEPSELEIHMSFKEIILKYSSQIKKCQELSSMYLNILGKFDDTGQTRVFDSKIVYVTIKNDLTKVEPNFSWRDTIEDILELENQLPVGLKSCFYAVEISDGYYRQYIYQDTATENFILKIEDKHCTKPFFSVEILDRFNQRYPYYYKPEFRLSFNKTSFNITLHSPQAFVNCPTVALTLEFSNSSTNRSSNCVERSIQFKKEYAYSVNVAELLNCSCKIKGTSQEFLYIGDMNITLALTGSIVAGVGVFFLLLVVSALLALIVSKKKTSILHKFHWHADPGKKSVFFDERISEIMEKVLEDLDAIRAEFKEIDRISEEEINVLETFDKARSPEVLQNQRNRYKDVIPFDSNVVLLKTPKGEVPLDYVNASEIRFPHLKQTYIAAQVC